MVALLAWLGASHVIGFLLRWLDPGSRHRRAAFRAR